ncbi:MAG: 50S ribosomal protein L29 [Bryobacterales bacterium]|nr:50S ribosomal protein L29 [Bryobacteraceae bacterium]MDW8131813.1 50S ribosomal protein L29 [Bryobacterales bacterium]
MKAEKFRELESKELRSRLQEINEELLRLRFQLSLGQVEALKKYRLLKKDRARVLTILRERELAAAREGAN